MNIQLDSNESHYQITRYQPGEIWMGETCYTESLLITPTVLNPWAPQRVEDLKTEHFESVIATSPEIFILGTGKEAHMLDPELFLPLYQLGIGIEVMDSLRAAYTFTLLSSEHRKVMVGMIIQ